MLAKIRIVASDQDNQEFQLLSPSDDSMGLVVKQSQGEDKLSFNKLFLTLDFSDSMRFYLTGFINGYPVLEERTGSWSALHAFYLFLLIQEKNKTQCKNQYMVSTIPVKGKESSQELFKAALPQGVANPQFADYQFAFRGSSKTMSGNELEKYLAAVKCVNSAPEDNVDQYQDTAYQQKLVNFQQFNLISAAVFFVATMVLWGLIVYGVFAFSVTTVSPISIAALGTLALFTLSMVDYCCVDKLLTPSYVDGAVKFFKHKTREEVGLSSQFKPS